MYIGFSNGNMSVLMLDQEPWHVVLMKYTIPWPVVLLNEHTESRTIKMEHHLSEGCIDMEIISTSSKHRQNYFILLGKSGHVYQYDDNLIERYPLQNQSKSTPSLPKEVVVKLPLADSSITTAKFISNNPNLFTSEDEMDKENESQDQLQKMTLRVERRDSY
ncbi:hypothetical protein GLYMA_01G158700v4 [Glycine max]|nr:hypothetical protein GLYMA_01G158700v4 [Glycine max]KAH1163333.1 hypothetical protein GYH30_001730 [Glycine max]